MDEKVHNVLLGRRQDVSDMEHVERVLVILEKMVTQSGIELTPMTQLHLAVLCADAKMHDRAMPLFDAAVSFSRGSRGWLYRSCAVDLSPIIATL